MDNVSTLSVKPDDVIIYRFDPDIDPESLHANVDGLKEEFPGHKVLAICTDMDVMSASPDDAVKMLERMIAHIKIVEAKPKIVI